MTSRRMTSTTRPERPSLLIVSTARSTASSSSLPTAVHIASLPRSVRATTRTFTHLPLWWRFFS